MALQAEASRRRPPPSEGRWLGDNPVEGARRKPERGLFLGGMGVRVESRALIRHDGVKERLTRLREKELINLRDGTRVGTVSDMELGLDGRTGRVVCIVVPKSRRWWNLWRRSREVCVPWHKVRKISGELIIIDHEFEE